MDERGLRQLLVNLIKLMKEDHEYSMMLGNELAALRDALQELSQGKFQPILDRHRASMKAKTASLGATIVSDYDELIRKIENGELF